MPEQIHTPALHSSNLKTNSKTYFFDVKAAKNGNKYLTITESRIGKDGQKFRGSVTVFQDQLKDFNQAVLEMSDKVKS